MVYDGQKKLTVEQQLCDEIAKYYADMLGFILFAYPWSTDRSLQMVELPEPWASRYNCQYGPDKWACELCDEISEEIKRRAFDGKHAVDPIEVSVRSGHGIGKSALTAWSENFIMSTRPFAQGTVTANTSTQLETRTWAQIARWTKKLINAHWWDIRTSKGNMKMWHVAYPDEWFCAAQTCRKENSEAFAGQHAANSSSFYIFDEASAVYDEIWEVSEGGLTDGEPWRMSFGNPTKNTGAFHKQHTKRRNANIIIKGIDSRTVQITNKKKIEQWEKEYGEDSDFFRVRVKGEFPRVSSMQLIPTDVVDQAVERVYPASEFRDYPIILGADVARFGDDASVIFIRQGMRIIWRKKYLNIDTMTFASEINERGLEYRCHVLFVDVVGIGAGVVDRLKKLGAPVYEVNGGNTASEKTRFFNKRMEMWWKMLEWLKAGGSIPDEEELKDDLTGIEYGYNAKEQYVLERKEDMKDRGLPSPDWGDALANTFAEPVTLLNQGNSNAAYNRHKHEKAMAQSGMTGY